MNEDLQIRMEKFGGIVASQKPPMLAFVDKDYIKGMGFKNNSLWKMEDTGLLSGPIEAHYALTDYCPAQCPGCYMGADDNTDLIGETGLKNALEVAKSLKKLKVFHVALGGGESFSIPWIFEIAKVFKDIGMVPNLTTSGLFLTKEKAAKAAPLFGQINVSMDGTTNKLFSHTRPKIRFETADGAVKILKRAGIRTGINCIITRYNFDHLEKIAQYAKKMKLTDIEFLRYKPTGRGEDNYHDMKLTKKQRLELLPKMKKISKRYRISLKLDCSFTPFICAHKPSKKVLDYFAIMGCDAGNWLIGVSPQGMASPCSFIKEEEVPVSNLETTWSDDKRFAFVRRWPQNTKTICRSCNYLFICRGGCRQIGNFLGKDFSSPDPECPFVEKGRFQI